MTKSLQEFGFDKNAYERSADAWVCGWAATGEHCRLGPDAEGNCRAAHECIPLRKGDRWQCSRPAHCGGACPLGPRPDGACCQPLPPCQPVRSLRGRRGLWTFYCTIFSVGFLFLMIGGHERMAWVSPGELTQDHGTVASNCGACHTTAVEKSSTWLPAALHPHHPLADSQRCIGCHDMGKEALHAHGMAAGQLDALTRKAKEQPTASAPLLLAAARFGPGVPVTKDKELACAVCHREHQGKNFRLSHMDDRKCQTCHVQQFTSLGQGHPDFSDYPYHRRTHLYFDHVTHIGRHFKEFQRIMPAGKAPNACVDCHVIDPSGRWQLLKSFDQTCASCHLPRIKDTTFGGILFLNLPGLDVPTLRQKAADRAVLDQLAVFGAWPRGGLPVNLALASLLEVKQDSLPPAVVVGAWPENADGDLSPFMRSLLSSDEKFARAQATLQGLDLCDLSKASNEQLRALEPWVWSIKALFHDLVRDGDQALVMRLPKTIREQLNAEAIASLTGDLPPELVRDAQQAWLPNLMTEVPAYRKQRLAPFAQTATSGGKPGPNAISDNSPIKVPERWYRKDIDYALYYRQKDHADDFIHNWLDLTGRHFSRSPGFRAVFDTLSCQYSPGGCTSCHGVAAQAGGSRQVLWQGFQHRVNDHPFTHFAHAPHFSLLGDKGCNTCHVRDRSSDYRSSFINANLTMNLDPQRFVSNFVGMKKTDCSKCHEPREAGDNCLKCHNYHIGTFGPLVPRSNFSRWGVR